MFKFFKSNILSFIYPHKCVFCEKITPKNNLLCSKCASSIKTDLLVKPLLEFEGRKVIYCISPFKYRGEVRDAVCRFKFYGYKDYSEFFSEIISNELNKNISNIKFDVVSAVPLSRERQSQRGYNQSEWLAKALGEKLGAPYEQTLVKIKHNFPQHELPLEQRVQNVKGVYKPSELNNIKGKNILLCDDVITTGNTLKECVKVLDYSGAKNVVCCTIAHV